MDYREKMKIYYQVEHDLYEDDLRTELEDHFGIDRDAQGNIDFKKLIDIFEFYLGNNQLYFDCYWQSAADAIDEYLSNNKIHV